MAGNGRTALLDRTYDVRQLAVLIGKWSRESPSRLERSGGYMSEPYDYPLGYSAQEARRLAERGALLEPFTEDVFRRAGLAPGMQVLDIGCGVGDVSLLAARIVGRQGAVLGIDRASSSVEIAGRRATALGFNHAQFQVADIPTFKTDQKFDALVGRLVLLYLPDPPAALRRLSQHLRPGAIVAFQEYDRSQFSQVPAGELFLQIKRWLLDAFVAAGTELDMGAKLYSTFVRAGLPPPSMVAATQVACGPSAPEYDYPVDLLRSLLPFIERAGIATAEEVGIDTLVARLRDDAVANERVIFLPRVVGAWSKLGGAVVREPT
jgi:ubiquinone/menaquinone biosynthesis C-methylase UbiE